MANPPSNPPNDDTKNIPSKPSEAYAKAFGSPVYRLSELMFGSLLASYVLGFTGLSAASLASTHPSGIWGVVLSILQYTFISITYAYLTASFFLSYHAGILTMHHMPLQRLRFDFLLALAQAILFGFSLLFPAGFPIFIGVLLLSASIRQRREHMHHIRKLYNKIGKGAASSTSSDDDDDERSESEIDEDELMSFENKFVKILQKRDYRELSIWKPAGMWLPGLAMVLILGGAAVLLLISWHGFPESLLIRGGWQFAGKQWAAEAWVTGEAAAITLITFLYGHSIARRRATFLYNRRNKTIRMDEEFNKLIAELKS